MQIDRLARRIDDLAHHAAPRSGPHIGFVWRMPGETDEAARARHALQYPEDATDSMLVLGWEPMTAAEWEKPIASQTDLALVRDDGDDGYTSVRLEQRIEALAAISGPPQVVVIEPDETVEQAIERLGPAASKSSIFIRTGVPRASTWGQW